MLFHIRLQKDPVILLAMEEKQQHKRSPKKFESFKSVDVFSWKQAVGRAIQATQTSTGCSWEVNLNAESLEAICYRENYKG